MRTTRAKKRTPKQGSPAKSRSAQARIACATCGVSFARKKGPGQPPKHCPEHRRERGEERDPEGNARRKAARQDAKRGAKANATRLAADPLGDILLAADLAAGLAVYPNDPGAAAIAAGIATSPAHLAQLVELARLHHGGMVDGDPEEVGRRALLAMHLTINDVLRGRQEIAPRDLSHVARALAQVRDYVSPKGGGSRFTEMTFGVIGADGQPMILSQPKPKAPKATE